MGATAGRPAEHRRLAPAAAAMVQPQTGWSFLMVQTLAQLEPDLLTTRELHAMGAGQAIGRYTLLRRIAAGGMAEVYVARSTGAVGFAKKVAIKKILPQHSNNDRFIDMLVDEAKITVSLTHPNIAHVYELGLHGEDYFLVMEYVEGRPLNKLMQRVDERGHGHISVEHSIHIMAEIAKGLDHAHKQRDDRGQPLGIVHRDVSPQNVLISYSGDVKLIDFGIARAEGRLNQTSAGVIKGKLRYLAPEIAAGDEPDHRADIYCCGIVLFEMLTGEAMFAPKSDLDAIEMATEARVRNPRSRNPLVPKDLDDIVMKALVRDRSHRYQTARDLANDLRRFLNQHSPSFVGSELGDFMQHMFAAEMIKERRLDEVAEQAAAKRPAEDEDPTLAQPAADDSHDRRYRPLVTHVAIGGADGGSAMVVVPADSNPPGRSGPSITLPPVGAASDETPPMGWGAPGEATVKAQNPFGPSVIPTVSGPPVTPRSPTVVMPDPSDTGLRPSEKSNLVARDISGSHAVISLVPGLKPMFATYALLGGAAVLALVAIGYSLAVSKTDPLPALEPNHKLEPVAITLDKPPLEPARLVLEVEPKVAITVTSGDKILADNAQPPVHLVLSSGRHALKISAEGHRSETLTHTVAAGEVWNQKIKLEPNTGRIELVGEEFGNIRASAGEVQGNQVLGVPLDTLVKLEVDRPGASRWITSVRITKSEPLILEVPEPKAVPPGTLVINARPKATVFINGKKRGETPLTVKLRPGAYKVLLEAADGRTRPMKASVRSGKTTKLTGRF